MIIVLKGADFSANNIGKVQVTTELHPYTKAAIDASGNTSLTGEQKSALNGLFLAMGVDGSNTVMSKIRKLYLPIICGDVSKALVNYTTSAFENDKVLSADYWTIRNNGLVGKSTNGQPITLKENSPITTSNFFAAFLMTEAMEVGVGDSSKVFALRGATDKSKFLGLTQSSASSNSLIQLGTYGPWNSFAPEPKGSIVTSKFVLSTPSVAYNYNSEGIKEKIMPNLNPDMSGETSQTLYVLGLSDQNTTKSYGAFMYGEAISKEEAMTIAEKLNALYATFA